MKYRKKPVVIDAFQWEGWTGIANRAPEWFDWNDSGYYEGKSTCWKSIGEGDVCLITTREGVMRADLGDWIIQGVKGELYPCKPDIFAATYEKAE
jgi:hypothetical protein